MNVTTLELVTSDGVALTGRRWEPTGTAGASVVVTHGFAASTTESKVVALAEALCAEGHAVVAVDARGHGTSSGATTLGDLERFDVAAAIGAAAPGPVVLVSASMGSIGVLRHLATGDESREVAGVVTVSCPARWRLPRNARGVLSALMTSTAPGRWATSRYVGVRVARPRPRPAPPIDLVPRIGVPVAIVHGRADPFIPVADAELLFAAAPDPKRLMLVDRLGHAFEPPAIPPVLESVAWILDQP